MESDTFALDLLDTTINEVLLHLEVRNAVTQQAACLGFALIDVNLVTGAAELLGSGETRRTGPDDRDLLACVNRGRLWHDKAQFVGLVGNCLFDRLDRNRRILKVQRASLARRGTDATGKFRKLLVE